MHFSTFHLLIQVYLIQTDGPGGLENTEVNILVKKSLNNYLKVEITDLGEIGQNANVVFEEAVGVGAEEIVCGPGQVLTISIIWHLLHYGFRPYCFIGPGICHFLGSESE